MIKNILYKSACFLLIFLGISVSIHGQHSRDGVYHWARLENPISLKIVDSTTGNWKSELHTALDEWSKPVGLHEQIFLDFPIVKTNSSKGARRRCLSIEGQIHVCNDSYGLNGWLGIATIYIQANGHITRGVAQVNDSYANYWNDWPTEKNHVMCQEIGHLFGLGHTSEGGSYDKSCMDYSGPPNNPLSQWPNEHDFEELAHSYSHLDTYKTYDDSVGDDGGTCNAPPGRGCNKNNNALGEMPGMGVRIYKDKRHEIWVAPGKEGGLWVRHVTLVPEEYAK